MLPLEILRELAWESNRPPLPARGNSFTGPASVLTVVLNYPGVAMPLQLEINGKRYPVQSAPDTTLLYVLREELGLTGSKYGCGEGQCGACTVLLSGSPRRSCQIAVSDAAGKSIATIEGLEKNGALHPVQQAFIDADAFQCAYCTSGMIMSSVALLQKNPNPAPADIVQSLQGNICRCGAHPRIIAAVQKASKLLREPAR